MAWFREEKFEWLTDEAIAAEEAARREQGTDASTRTIEQTQSTNPDNSVSSGALRADTVVPVYDESQTNRAVDVGATSPELKTEPGVGAKEDSGSANEATTQSAVNAGTANATTIKPQPNILDRFASYTYSASVYLVTPEQYTQYLRSKKKNINGYNLLFQSGGAPNNVGGARGAANGNTGQGQGAGVNDFLTAQASASGDAGRNPNFPNDFYIDSITIQNVLFGKGTNAAHSSTDLKFTVVEPANITLIDCLYKAVQDSAPTLGDGSINYAAATYMMVIRFYGYDLNGNVHRVGAASAQGLTDPNAVVEKFIPFKIKEIQFSVSNKLVTYEFQCVPIAQLIALGTRHGSIPQDVELTGSTVGSMLMGDPTPGTSAQAGAATPGAATTAQTASDGREVTSSSTPTNGQANAPANASAAPTNKTNKPNKQGLMAALNELQQQYVKDNVYEVANVYKIEFVNGAEEIRDAKVAKPDAKTAKQFTPMGAAPSQNPSQSSPDKGAMDSQGRNQAVAAGQPIVQMIDQVIRNSAYITDQAMVTIDETTGKPVPSPNASTKKDMKWYTVMMQSKQLGYDKKRNDYAYEITFVIAPYQLTDFKSVYFPEGKFQGIHKKYPWWFTGVNTSVLDYQATFNKMYILTVTGSPTEASKFSQGQQAYMTLRETPFKSYQPRSTENSQGAAGKANELAANAAEYLYHPGDNANAKVRIIGDPAWIQQGSVTGDATSVSPAPFLPDGTINFDFNDVLFEISWQRPEDYSLSNGLADPYARTQSIFGDRGPVQNAVYRARMVTSEFNRGKFEQTIEGTLYSIPVKTPASPASASIGSQLSTSPSDDAAFAELDADMAKLEDERAFAELDSDLASLNKLKESAQSSTYGETGLKSAPNLASISLGESTGEFSFTAPQPNDTAFPAIPAGPATSDGSIISTITTESRTQAQPMTVEQLAAAREEVLEGRLRMTTKIPNGPVIVQDISREF